MKVLFFTKYTRAGASSRLRTFQYLDFFTANGIECTVSPFFSEQYLAQVYRSKTHNKWYAFKAFLHRLRVLIQVKKFDKVVIEKELFPYFPAVFEWMLSVAGVKYISDYDDAIFHNYDVSPNKLVRFMLGDKIRKVVRYAHIVVAGNDYLRSTFIEYGARKVVIIPTVIDTGKYSVRPPSEQKVFTIGWIGSPITFKYLSLLKPVFRSLLDKHSFRILYVGADRTLGLPNEQAVAWTEMDEAKLIQSFDVGIMPLEDNIWERGKCGYKLIQYMGSGVPVIGTPIGVNEQLITDGFNGFKASSVEEWERVLEKMITNTSSDNTNMGLNGRKLVEERYSLQIYRKVWLQILKHDD